MFIHSFFLRYFLSSKDWRLTDRQKESTFLLIPHSPTACLHYDEARLACKLRFCHPLCSEINSFSFLFRRLFPLLCCTLGSLRLPLFSETSSYLNPDLILIILGCREMEGIPLILQTLLWEEDESLPVFFS